MSTWIFFLASHESCQKHACGKNENRKNRTATGFTSTNDYQPHLCNSSHVLNMSSIAGRG